MKNLSFIVPIILAQDNSTFTHKALSDMSHFFENNKTDFDPIYFQKLESCLNDNDLRLMDS
jgi:hypothetical protein